MKVLLLTLVGLFFLKLALGSWKRYLQRRVDELYGELEAQRRINEVIRGSAE